MQFGFTQGNSGVLMKYRENERKPENVQNVGENLGNSDFLKESQEKIQNPGNSEGTQKMLRISGKLEETRICIMKLGDFDKIQGNQKETKKVENLKETQRNSDLLRDTREHF